MEATSQVQAVKLTRKDFDPGIDVRWCPGCGDYAVLAAVQRALPELPIPREKYAFISGIGCSSRFPYYMNTYGFHTIHGRAPAVALGLKASRPDLSVWVATGDGDALSIGGNHLIHTLRRNPDINILLFNNRIYGLTKGQLSPTSELGKKTKSSPVGSAEQPMNPVSLALGAEGTFIARALDRDAKHLAQIILAAAQHKGTSFLEIFQNCVIFNDGAFDALTDKTTRDENVLYLEHGQPMLFGKDRNKGIRIDAQGRPEVVTVGENGVTLDQILVHDERAEDPSLAFMLSRMGGPHFPTPVGIFRLVEKPVYEEVLQEQIRRTQEKKGRGDLAELLRDGETWQVGPQG